MAKKVSIPWELKYKYLKGMLTTLLKGFLYAIREEYGAAAVFKMYETVCKMDDRVKKMIITLKDVFKIEGNNMEAIETLFDIWMELVGWEYIWSERSRKRSQFKVPFGCAWRTRPQDISDWILIIFNVGIKAINPKASIERSMGMCAGDPSCEYIIKLEE